MTRPFDPCPLPTEWEPCPEGLHADFATRGRHGLDCPGCTIAALEAQAKVDEQRFVKWMNRALAAEEALQEAEMELARIVEDQQR